jgi:hypothetical protein
VIRARQVTRGKMAEMAEMAEMDSIVLITPKYRIRMEMAV